MFFKPLLYPILAMVGLTVLVWLWMYVTRLRLIFRRDIDPQQLASRAQAERLLADVAGPAENLRNLFEMPVLFYSAMLLAVVLFVHSPALVSLAWCFVFLRALHSLVHCTYNRVEHRFMVYVASCFALFGMWTVLGWWILSR